MAMLLGLRWVTSVPLVADKTIAERDGHFQKFGRHR